MEDQLGRFKPVGLEEIDDVKASMRFLRRHDTKFVFSLTKLEPLLESLAPFYRILEIEGRRFFGYENLYFDTPSFYFYLEHHNRRFPRQKVRFRRYLDSGVCYFELKTKSNKRETAKERLSSLTMGLNDEHKDFLRPKLLKSCQNFEDLVPSIWTRFKRITLTGKNPDERITIDTDISFEDMNGKEFRMDGLAVAESKHGRNVIGTPFIKAARELRIFEERFSKYCTGVSALYSEVRANRFKNRLRKIVKISGGHLNGIS